jgi:hypothetical protein
LFGYLVGTPGPHENPVVSMIGFGVAIVVANWIWYDPTIRSRRQRAAPSGER